MIQATSNVASIVASHSCTALQIASNNFKIVLNDEVSDTTGDAITAIVGLIKNW